MIKEPPDEIVQPPSPGVRSERTHEVRFGNGNVASLLVEAPDTSAAEMVTLLGLQGPAPVVIVAGGADSLDQQMARRLHRLFDRAVIPAAMANGALLADGGTSAGVMTVLGQAAAARDPGPPLLGVAPVRKVTYPGDGTVPGDVSLDENHSHFVLAKAEDWGDETQVLMDLVEEIAGPSPVVTIIAGGRDGTLEEAVQSVRRRWPLIVLQGTGGAADVLTLAMNGETEQGDDTTSSSVINEIVTDGEVDVFPLDHDPATLSLLIARRLQQDASLRLAWEQFAMFDRCAIRHQRDARRTQILILLLGVIGTALALTQTQAEGDLASWADRALRYTILLIPIILTALIAAAGRFKAASKWVVLRGAAEALKREIYRFRARAGAYAPTGAAGMRAQVKLATVVGEITSTAMQSDVNLTALRPFDGALPPPGAVRHGDDGFALLGAERYLEVRLLDQLAWYRRKAVTLESRMRLLRWTIIVIGGVGTFLAAIGLELWIALTTAVAGAAASFLAYEQVENTLLHYNQAAAGLDTIRQWWVSLPVNDQVLQANVDRLVDSAEQVMQTEQTGWVQGMQEALAELRRQTEAAAREESGT